MSGFTSEYRDPKSDSPRVFATGNSLQFMPGWLRQDLFPDWFELDFSNMHLSILNARAELNIDLSRSIWDQIFESWDSKLNKIYSAVDSGDYEAALKAGGLFHLFTGTLNSGSEKTFKLPNIKTDLARTKKALACTACSSEWKLRLLDVVLR